MPKCCGGAIIPDRSAAGWSSYRPTPASSSAAASPPTALSSSPTRSRCSQWPSRNRRRRQRRSNRRRQSRCRGQNQNQPRQRWNQPGQNRRRGRWRPERPRRTWQRPCPGIMPLLSKALAPTGSSPPPGRAARRRKKNSPASSPAHGKPPAPSPQTPRSSPRCAGRILTRPAWSRCSRETASTKSSPRRGGRCRSPSHPRPTCACETERCGSASTERMAYGCGSLAKCSSCFPRHFAGMYNSVHTNFRYGPEGRNPWHFRGVLL